MLHCLAVAAFLGGACGLAEAKTWIRSVGVAGSPQELWEIERAPDGGAFAAGVTTEGATGTDLFVMRVDSLGNSIWQKRCGGAGTESPNDLCIAADGGFVIAARRDNDAWILKFDAIGALAWQKAYGGAGTDVLTSVEPTVDGGFVLAGYSDSYGGAGLAEGWVVKTDSLGNVLWSKIYGGVDVDVFAHVRPASDGGYVLTGRTKSWSAGDFDIWVMKLDSTGNPIWQKAYGGGAEDRGNWSGLSADGGYVVAGRTSSYGAGSRDGCLLRLTSSGAVTWAKTYGSAADEAAFTKGTGDGGFVIFGTRDFGNPNLDGFLIKTTSTGTISWQKTIAYPEYDRLASVAETGNGYFLAGGSTHFDAPQGDALIASVSSSGTISSACEAFLTDSSFVSSSFSPTASATAVTVTPVSPGSLAGSTVTDVAYGVGYVCTASDMPDLTGIWTQVKAKGSKVSGTLKCQNGGSVAAGSFTVRIYLSSKPTAGKGATLISTKSAPSLSPGASLSIRAKGTKEKKQKYFVAVVDATHAVTEDDEANNTLPAALQ